MTNHRRMLILAATSIDFGLTSDERTVLDAHIASCPDCGRDVHRVRAQATQLAERPWAIPRPGMRERVEVEWRRRVYPSAGASMRRLALAAAAVVAIIGIAAVGAGSRRDAVVLRSGIAVPSEAPAAAQPTSIPGVAAVGGVRTITGRAKVGRSSTDCALIVLSDCVSSVTVADGSVWATTRDGVLRLDPATDAVIAEVRVGSYPHRLWFADGSVWTTVQDPGTLVRIDPATNTVAEKVDVGGSPVGIVDAVGSIWVVDQTGDRVLRIDPRTDDGGQHVAGQRVQATIQLDVHPWGIAAMDGSIWVTDRHARTLLRIDPATNAVSETIDITAGDPADSEATADVGAGFGRIWVAGSDSVKSYDPATGQVEDHPTQTYPRLAIGPDAVWVSGSWNYLIQRLDPTTGAVTAQSELPVPEEDYAPTEASVAVAPDATLWVALSEGNDLIRVTPTP